MQNEPSYLQALRQVARLLLPVLLVIVSVALLWPAAGVTEAPIPRALSSQNQVVSLSERVAISPTVELSTSWYSNESDRTERVAWGDVDADGDLDLAVANKNQANKLYKNEDGMLTVNAKWESNDSDESRSVAWGDVDGDGDLDLAVGNYQQRNKLYENEGGMFSESASWESNESDKSQSLAWGDVDGDGDLDLVVGNWSQPNKLYLNEGIRLSLNASWESNDNDWTQSVAWGDVDGDGDLDLAVGNYGQNKLYLNDGITLSLNASWRSKESDYTSSVAWGDVDADGDLDLAVGNNGQNKLYKNENGMLTEGASWQANEGDSTISVAWGDVDADGDLDLTVGNNYQPNKLYKNEGGILTPSVSWQSNDSDETQSVAWADVDGDGDLDLAVGNWGRNKLYKNEGSMLNPIQIEESNNTDYSRSMVWGDVDADGDLDLAVGNWGENKLYENEGGILMASARWESLESDKTSSVAWGDMDADGDLDLTGGNFQDSNKLYLNEGEMLTVTARQFLENDLTYSVAWGDVDGDGDLDLAFGNWGAPNKLYLNEGGMLTVTASWQPVTDETSSVAWGDVDGDGDLDLAVGNNEQPNKLYKNEGGMLASSHDWQSNESDETRSVAWGDVDGDGDLDLAVGNEAEPSKLYLNEDGILSASASWQSNESDWTQSVAWGDVDGDGDLDLAVGNDSGQSSKLYKNEGGMLSPGASWQSNESDFTQSVAWGDVDADGDLDLAVGNWSQPNRLYKNERPAHPLHPAQRVAMAISTLALAPADFYALSEIRTGVIPITYTLINPAGTPMREVRAFYSPDGGGRWQPAVASHDTISTNLSSGVSIQSHSALPIGDNGTLSSTLSFSDNGKVGNLEVSLTISHTNSSQLAAALYTPWPVPTGTQVLLFDGVGGEAKGFANLTLSDQAVRPIDRATGVVYTSTGGVSSNSIDVPQTIPGIGPVTSTLLITQGPVVITDVNVINLNGTQGRMGDLELALQSPAGTVVELMNHSCGGTSNFNLNLDDEASAGDWPCPPVGGGIYQPESPLSAFDGEDSHGTWTLMMTDTSAPATGGELERWGLSFNTLPDIITTTLHIEGRYKPVQPLAGLRGAPLDIPFTLIITDSTASGLLQEWELASSGYEHVYHWDVLASGFFGLSDNMVFRMEALPNLAPITNSIPGPFQRPFVSAQTYPGRVRGSQVQVLSGTMPVKDALVYRLPASETTGAEPFANHAGQFFRTDTQGYLQGRGEIAIGDELFALLPITSTDNYTLYHTSATPTESGLMGLTVNEFGVQELIVSADNPLILFDLDISLEWDARNDDVFLEELQNALKRSSQVLYDVSNGQMALGEVRVHQAKENWLNADVALFASPDIHPSATLGGVVITPTSEIGVSGGLTDAYWPAPIRMGPGWDPFGLVAVDLAEDWWRALSHELGHYLLFLPDNYIGIENGALKPTDCRGSFMTKTSDDGYSEFLNAAEWENVAECQSTVAEYTTGRSDWETITHFYPMLHDSPTNLGPAILPLEVTQITFVEPASAPSNVLPARTFDLRDAEGGALLLIPEGRGYLIKTNGTASDLSDDILINLGETGGPGDRIMVRGAEAGDRLCVSGEGWFGCEQITALGRTVHLSQVPDWQPNIQVTPLSPVTLAVTVTLETPAPNLNMQVLPATGHPLTPTITYAPSASMIPLDAVNPITFSQVITLNYPAFAGSVRVWTDSPAREAMSEYFLSIAAWGGDWGAWGGDWGAWGGNSSGWGAPLASGDGQVKVFNVENPFGQTGISALQSLTHLPHLPAWFTVVGQGYGVTQDANFTETITRTISFNYLQRDVPAGYEFSLRIYYSPDDGTSWQQLPTELDTDENLAVAVMPAEGAGIYALISMVEIGLPSAGWNLFAYPIQATRPVSEALQSISDYYTTVYGYEANDTTDPWKLYDVTVPDWVNDLHQLAYGRGYWINTSQPITLGLLVDIGTQLARTSTPASPPATYYGLIEDEGESLSQQAHSVTAFQPQAGLPVMTWIGQTLCGQGQTETVDGQVVYTLDVWSEQQKAGCGAAGRVVSFQVGSQWMATTARWDNSQVYSLSLSSTHRLYMPLIGQ